MRVRVGRNLKAFPLPGAMTAKDRKSMEAKMCTAFDALSAMPAYGGGYVERTLPLLLLLLLLLLPHAATTTVTTTRHRHLHCYCSAATHASSLS